MLLAETSLKVSYMVTRWRALQSRGVWDCSSAVDNSLTRNIAYPLLSAHSSRF